MKEMVNLAGTKKWEHVGLIQEYAEYFIQENLNNLKKELENATGMELKNNFMHLDSYDSSLIYTLNVEDDEAGKLSNFLKNYGFGFYFECEVKIDVSDIQVYDELVFEVYFCCAGERIGGVLDWRCKNAYRTIKRYLEDDGFDVSELEW
jgi:hypothetical protein